MIHYTQCYLPHHVTINTKVPQPHHSPPPFTIIQGKLRGHNSCTTSQNSTRKKNQIVFHSTGAKPTITTPNQKCTLPTQQPLNCSPLVQHNSTTTTHTASTQFRHHITHYNITLHYYNKTTIHHHHHHYTVHHYHHHPFT